MRRSDSGIAPGGYGGAFRDVGEGAADTRSASDGNSDAQAFGEIRGNNRAFENAVLTGPYTGGNSVHNKVVVASCACVGGNASKGGSGLNLFSDPNATYALFRRPILGMDTTGGGAGVLCNPTLNINSPQTWGAITSQSTADGAWSAYPVLVICHILNRSEFSDTVCIVKAHSGPGREFLPIVCHRFQRAFCLRVAVSL